MITPSENTDDNKVGDVMIFEKTERRRDWDEGEVAQCGSIHSAGQRPLGMQGFWTKPREP